MFREFDKLRLKGRELFRDSGILYISNDRPAWPAGQAHTAGKTSEIDTVIRGGFPVLIRLQN